MENHCCFFLDWLLCGMCRWLGLRRESLPQPFSPQHSSPRWLHPSPCRLQGWLPHTILVLISGGAAPCPELGRGGGVGRACPRRCCGRGWKQRGLGPGAALPPPGSTAGQPPISHPPPVLQLGTKPAAIIQAKHVNLADPAAPV